MELWIRSQDKERLIKCDEKLEIFDRNSMPLVKEYAKDLKLEVMIIANDNINLGAYKTKQRALEVLDEIQAVIMVNGLLPCELKQELNKRNIDLNDRAIFNIKTNKCLYIMPQE